MSETELQNLMVGPSANLRNAMDCLNKNCKGIVLVTDDQKKLLGTITDGDIRRAFLSNISLDAPVSQLLEMKQRSAQAKPVVGKVGTSNAKLLQQMQEAEIRQIPLLTEDGKVAGLTMLEDLLPQEALPMQAVIMAGGQGSRLYPLTQNTPKPMLPVGGQPVIQRMIEQMRQAGIQQVNVTTHYLKDQIENYFGDGQKFGVNINYVAEDKPLGTAGSLGLLGETNDPLLVVNGDILTKVDFRSMLDFHREHKAELTVAVRQYDLQVPYGIIDCEEERVMAVREKPAFKFLVNAGIYLLQPSALRSIPSDGRRYDMTDLIAQLIAAKKNVVSFPIVEYWLDIGQFADYEKAQRDIESDT